MKIYLVGGAIRNFFLKLPVKDRDWVVTNSNYIKMNKLGYKQVGKNFPVFLHPKTHEEYALARLEKKISIGYKGFKFITNSKVSLLDDLKRRDLTINAIAINPFTKKIYDPYNGIKDIKLKIIKHVSSSFIEDPLRILRVARFASEFYYLKFNVNNLTLKLITKMSKKNELNNISSERIWEETEKALSTHNPEIFFTILHHCKALKIIYPEIDKLYINKIYCKNLAYHSLKCLKFICKITKDISIRFTIILQNICKNIKKSIIKVNNLCERLHIPNNIKNLSIKVIKYQDKINNIVILSPKKCLLLLNKLDYWRNPSLLDKIIYICEINYFIDKKNIKLNKYYPIFLPKFFFKKILQILTNININYYINKLKKKNKNNLIKKIIDQIRLKFLTKWRYKIYS